MKKILEKIISTGLALSMLGGMITTSASALTLPANMYSSKYADESTFKLAADTSTKGLRFDSMKKEYAQLKEAVALPETVEARVKLDSGENRRQVILGNYKGAGEVSWALEVNADNTLRYWEKSAKGELTSCKFDGVNNVAKINICTDEWVLVSIVRDRTQNKVLAYINGKLAGTYNIGSFQFAQKGILTGDPTRLGTDYRSVPFWMDGEIEEIRLWDKALSQEEIAQYASGSVTGTEDGLAHAWKLNELENVGPMTVFEDLVSNNGVNIITEGFQHYESAGFTNMSGVRFENADAKLSTEKRLTDIPRSFETTIKLPKNLKNRGGVIIGNYMNAGYYDMDLGYVNLEVGENGQPRLYWSQKRRNQKPETQDVTFPGVDLRQDDWIHLAVTFDETKDLITCYINGVKFAEVENCTFNPIIPAQALQVGGDYRFKNEQYFKGEIANVSIWSEVRTQEQIKADVEALKESASNVPDKDDGTMASWSFAVDNGSYADLSGHGNDVTPFTDWLEPEFATGDYSMVVLPDTQFLSSTYNQLFYDLSQWIVDNKETYNIQSVMHMGDTVNSNNDKEWSVAQKAMKQLNATDINWMPMMGNHDNTTRFNNNFPYEEYSQKNYFGGSFQPGKMDHIYWFTEAGGREYMIFSLGFSPSSAVLDWADKKIDEYPEKNVIITTHAYMNWDGTRLNKDDPDSAPTDGDDIWNQLGKKHDNVVLCLSGHIGFPDLVTRTDEQDDGDLVASVLCDGQGLDSEDGGYGMFMMLTFHEDSDTVDVNWYSVKKNKLYRERNQFSIQVPHIDEIVTGVDTQRTITADVGTAQDKLGLPATVGVTLKSGTTRDLPVT